MSAWIWLIGWGILDTFLKCRFLTRMLGAKYRCTPVWFYLGSLLYGQVNVAFALAVTARSNLIYHCACAFVLNIFLFHGSVIKKGFFTLWVYCAHGSVFGALFPLAHAAAIAGGGNGCPDTVINGVGIAASLVQFLMMEVLQRKLHVLKRDFTDRDALYLMYIVLFIYGAVDMMLTLFTGISGWTAETAVPVAWSCSLIAIAGAGLHVYCVVMLEHRLLERSAEQQYQMMGRHLEVSKGQYQQLLQIQHDIKNHALCLKNLLEDGKGAEAVRYLRQLDDRMEQGRAEVQTGSVFVDALLSPKYHQAKRLGIDISISMSVPAEDEVAPADICCLLANALDNAVEACQRGGREDTSAGWVKMKSKMHKKYWVFEISNSIHVPPAVDRGMFLSSKRKQAYGVGLQNIRAVVERYGGVMEIKNETHFTLSVMLPRKSDRV